MGDSTRLTLLDGVTTVRPEQKPFIAPRRRLTHRAQRVGAAIPTTFVPSVDVSALAWQDDSRCVGADPELFFPDGPVSPYVLALCRGCPVITQCLDHALHDPRLHGIWAATTAEERHRIRDRIRRAG